MRGGSLSMAPGFETETLTLALVEASAPSREHWPRSVGGLPFPAPPPRPLERARIGRQTGDPSMSPAPSSSLAS